jgi:hypothetical protein
MKTKRAVDKVFTRRLREAGCPMPEDCEASMPGLAITVSRPEITRINVMRGWAEYVLALRITNRSYVCLELQKFECYFPWPIRLIGPMEGGNGRSEKRTYRLPGSGRTFPYASVLNDRTTGRAGRIDPGDSLEGVLLAFRCQPFPDECLAGPVISTEVSILDQDGMEHVSEIRVSVDRTAIINSLCQAYRQGRGLYDAYGSQSSVAVREQARRLVAAGVLTDFLDVNPKLETYQDIPDEYS